MIYIKMFNSNTILSRIMSIGEVRRQSIVSFILQIALTLIGFLSTVYFAHAVGASALGAYFLVMAYYGIISMVTDGGFGGAAIKRISEGEEQDEYLSAFLVVRSLFTIGTVAALIAFRSYFVDLNNSGVFNWLLLALILSIFSGSISYGIIGRGKMGIRSTCNFIGEVLRILIQIVAVFLGFGIAGLLGGFVAGLVSAAMIEWHFFDLRMVSFDWRHIKSLSTFSFWLFLTSSGAALYSYTDTILIGHFLSNSDVGVYRIVFQFTSVALLVSSALVTTLWPKVSRWGKTGEKGLVGESLTKACSYSMVFAVPILVGGVLLGDRLLYFFYGAEFAHGYAPMVILLIVQIMSIFQQTFLSYLGALDHQKYAFKVTAAGAAANIAMNALLIPIIGISGAAIATLVTMSLNMILARRELSQVITVNLDKITTMNILKASFAMAIFLVIYRMLIQVSNVWLAFIPVVLGGTIYAVLMLKLDSKLYDELKTLTTQIRLPWPDWI